MTDQRRVRVDLRIEPDLLETVDRMAAAEHHSRSNMLRVLIKEAMQARQQKGKR